MRLEVKVPQLPESVSEATLLDWHKQPGDAIRRDENLIDLETDKVVLEVPAQEDGTLAEIRVKSGEVVEAGTVIAVIDTEGAASANAGGNKESDQGDAPPPAGEPSATGEDPAPAAAGHGDGDGDGDGDGSDAAPILSPAAQRLVSEHGLQATAIDGSGRDGRVTKEDVLRHLDGDKPARAEASAPQPADAPAPGARREERVPMTRIRARIAERLVEAQQTAASLTTVNAVDMQPVMDLRQRYKAEFEKAHGVRLGFMSFFIKAAVEALKRFPVVNASVDGNAILYHDYFDIGVAVSTPRGLVVPVLRDCDQLGFAEIEQQINDLGLRARDNKIKLEELQGGTFSITNGGIFGSMLSTPILNPPQSGILGMHNIVERPVAVAGEVVIRPVMYLALSYDHRIIDGREAVQFLVTVKQMLEDPARLLLQL